MQFFPTARALRSSIERVTDGELAELGRNGDTAAFGELVSRHKLAVYRTALAALGSPADAEDVAQEAFILAFRHLKTFRGDASVKTWMVTIAWRLALTRRRSLSRYVKRRLAMDSAAGEAIRSPQPSPELQLLEADTAAQVRRLIRALPSKLRDALLLSMSGDMTSDEVAAVLRVPPGTLRWRLMEARRLLRQRLAKVGITSLR